MKNTAVFGIYPTREATEMAVDALRAAGFRSEDISALFPDNTGTKDFAMDKSTKAPEGAATGATSGAVVGGVLGWLTGIGVCVGLVLAFGLVLRHARDSLTSCDPCIARCWLRISC